MASATRIGTRIKKRRQVLGLTQDELAGDLGVSKSTVANWERGQHYPQRYLGALEHRLGISLDGDGEDSYTDPAERAIWEDPDLPESDKRDFIARLRAKRREHAPQARRPPA
jgi:transcriptional regulator with XRE-family HTH domain